MDEKRMEENDIVVQEFCDFIRNRITELRMKKNVSENRMSLARNGAILTNLYLSGCYAGRIFQSESARPVTDKRDLGHDGGIGSGRTPWDSGDHPVAFKT